MKKGESQEANNVFTFPLFHYRLCCRCLTPSVVILNLLSPGLLVFLQLGIYLVQSLACAFFPGLIPPPQMVLQRCKTSVL